MRSLWPRLPDEVLGRPVPARFRRLSTRFADPDRLLVEFVDWLERSAAAPPPEQHSPGRDRPSSALDARSTPTRSATGTEDRRLLLETCIDVMERVPIAALEERLASTLEATGVREVRADGERFDPTRHRALGGVPTNDPSKHEIVASTESVGYEDRGEVVRPPEVMVYLLERTP